MSKGGEDMLSWGGAEPVQTLQTLLQALARLLELNLPESTALSAGQAIAQPCPPCIMAKLWGSGLSRA